MTTITIRALVATILVSSFAAVGCAAQTEQPVEPSATTDDSEASVGEVKQALIACGNDVPATGFVEFPYNQVNYGANSGWKSGCVGFRVDRNLPYPQNVPAEAQALGDFPQFEGDYTPTKFTQCRNSYINAYFAEKAGPEGSYTTEYAATGVHAEPTVVYDASSPSLLRITSCRAQKWRGAGCTWFPQHNYQRVDVQLVVNGNPSTPIGSAKAYAMFKNDTAC